MVCPFILQHESGSSSSALFINQEPATQISTRRSKMAAARQASMGQQDDFISAKSSFCETCGGHITKEDRDVGDAKQLERLWLCPVCVPRCKRLRTYFSRAASKPWQSGASRIFTPSPRPLTERHSTVTRPRLVSPDAVPEPVMLWIVSDSAALKEVG